MIEYKKGGTARVPVRLLDSTGAAVTGKVYTDVSVSVLKSDGTVASPALSAPNFSEVTSGAFSGKGFYTLILPATATDVSGALVYIVTATGADAYVGAVKIVDNEEVDTKTVVDSISTQMTRVLGLLHENSLLDQTSFDGSNHLLTARLRIYDTKANCDAAQASSPAGGTTGLLETYTVTAVYSSGNMLNYRITR